MMNEFKLQKDSGKTIKVDLLKPIVLPQATKSVIIGLPSTYFYADFVILH